MLRSREQAFLDPSQASTKSTCCFQGVAHSTALEARDYPRTEEVEVVFVTMGLGDPVVIENSVGKRVAAYGGR